MLLLGSRSASDLQNFIFIYLVDLYAMFCLCVVHSGYFNNNSYKRVCTCWYYRRYRVFLHTITGCKSHAGVPAPRPPGTPLPTPVTRPPGVPGAEL